VDLPCRRRILLPDLGTGAPHPWPRASALLPDIRPRCSSSTPSLGTHRTRWGTAGPVTGVLAPSQSTPHPVQVPSPDCSRFISFAGSAWLSARIRDFFMFVYDSMPGGCLLYLMRHEIPSIVFPIIGLCKIRGEGSPSSGIREFILFCFQPC